jgi:hypothetical protein
MLKVIQNARTIGACQQALKRAVTSLADEAREHRVGYPGGGTDTKIYYLKGIRCTGYEGRIRRASPQEIEDSRARRKLEAAERRQQREKCTS